MIEMLDLKAQQSKILAELQRAIGEVLQSAHYIGGRTVETFEANFAAYCSRKHAVGVGSGSSALHLALLALGVGPGDEVITVPNSFIATTEAIVHAGARPVFCDIDADTQLMNAELLRDLVTGNTRAILPVHLYGAAADVPRMLEVLAALGRNDIRILEDCAHAAGARHAGMPVPLGGLGAFSFNPGKNIGALGDAGAVVTDDAELASRVRLLRDHGRSGKNDHVAAGFNSRLAAINAAVLNVKLPYLDAWNARRREIAGCYDTAFAALDGAEPVFVPAGASSSRHQYVLRVNDRDRFRDDLQKRSGIATAVHYPSLICDQTAISDRFETTTPLPIARSTNPLLVSLPCHPELADGDVEKVISAVLAFQARELEMT